MHVEDLIPHHITRHVLRIDWTNDNLPSRRVLRSSLYVVYIGHFFSYIFFLFFYGALFIHYHSFFPYPHHRAKKKRKEKKIHWKIKTGRLFYTNFPSTYTYVQHVFTTPSTTMFWGCICYSLYFCLYILYLFLEIAVTSALPPLNLTVLYHAESHARP
jgi:hypothetical protein